MSVIVTLQEFPETMTQDWGREDPNLGKHHTRNLQEFRDIINIWVLATYVFFFRLSARGFLET